MRLRRLFLIIVAIIVAFIFLFWNAYGIGFGFPVKFETVEKRQLGGRWGPPKVGYHVIQSVEEWMEVFGEPLPEIDFSKKTVIAVCLGTFTHSGYAIEIRQIVDTGLTVVVKVYFITFVDKVYLPVLTTPYHVVTISKVNKPIIFKTFEVMEDC